MARTKKKRTTAKRDRALSPAAAAGEPNSGEPTTEAVEDDEPPAQKLKMMTKKERVEQHKQLVERNKDLLRRFLEGDDSLNEDERARGEILAKRAAKTRDKQDAKLHKPAGCTAIALYKIRPRLVEEDVIRAALAKECGEVVELRLARAKDHAFGLVRFASSESVDKAKDIEGKDLGFRVRQIQFILEDQLDQRRQKIAEFAEKNPGIPQLSEAKNGS
mmetsp:Transcript_21599/g.29401  ORF Transcript_21599/g.29401 Transcript_21599/m.29401 type:complete len:218 (-) Transcript_21599:463-1116(-)